MKNKKQKTPKIPKYSAGGNPNFNEFGNNIDLNNSGTQNIYNEGRSNKINAGQYTQYGQAAMGLGSQFATNSQLTGNERKYADNVTMNQTADTAIQAVPGFGQYYGFMKGASDMGKSMLAKDEYGNYKTGVDKAGNEIMTADHAHMINDISNKNYTALGLDSMGVGKFARMFSDVTGNSQKTDGSWGKFNKFVGITPDKQYANGGMNIQPNAEVEKQENTLNPDGTTTQFDGSSHEQGGIKTNLDPGTLIFSDKLKLNGKTFAKLNKPNMTHKEDKILADDKASAMSKLTANLMKQAKNKSSIELFEAQEALKQSKLDSYTKRLGGIMKYPNGGITPEQYKQAQSDSTILYKAGLNPNISNFEYPGYNDAYLRLNQLNHTPPVPISGTQGYDAQFKKPVLAPYKEVNPSVNGSPKVVNYSSQVNHPNYNQYIPGINKSEQKTVVVDNFRNGGKSRKTDPNNIDVLNARQQRDYQAWYNANSSDEGFNPDDFSVDNYMKQYESRGASTPTISSPNTGSSGQDGKFDWKGLGTQTAYFAANNAGNIYDLARANKVENTKFQRATASLLDPTAALRDATEQTRRAEYNVRGASGGNAGTYLSNRVGLNAQNIENKDRIRQQYANANAGISNQVNQLNTGIANQEYVANEQNRAVSRNIKQGTIASIGSNTANQMNDVRNTDMDQKKLDGLIKMYPALSKDPEMLKYFMSFHK